MIRHRADAVTKTAISTKVWSAPDHVAGADRDLGPVRESWAVVRGDADVALELNASDAGALALKRDAERAKKLALRENKKLAKEVTQWVETAQGKFTENGGDAGDCAQQ